MKAKITAFINNLIIYDYVLFGSVFALFILFIVLAILLRAKLGLSILLVFLSFFILIFGPTLGYTQMHKFVFKNELILSSQKKLSFTKAVVIKGTISNSSKFDFISCKITANAYKVAGNKIKDFIFPFSPFKKASIFENDISKGEIREFKMFIEPFTYSKDYNISIDSSCQ
ncbi:MAG: DUF2393 family protein [Campylobacterota bacterium]|nr:DUF2393 family protein [Campylobacterota bacterium]